MKDRKGKIWKEGSKKKGPRHRSNRHERGKKPEGETGTKYGINGTKLKHKTGSVERTQEDQKRGTKLLMGSKKIRILETPEKLKTSGKGKGKSKRGNDQ